MTISIPLTFAICCRIPRTIGGIEGKERGGRSSTKTPDTAETSSIWDLGCAMLLCETEVKPGNDSFHHGRWAASNQG
jgi:hypothetical protein